MPELPEVETTRRGLARRIIGHRIVTAVVRNSALRLPVAPALANEIAGRVISDLARRGKYLLIGCGDGTLIVHLGMSGRLWLVDQRTPPDRHDHFDLVLESGQALRLRDPRRFGLVLWQSGDPLVHPLLAAIGPEPLSDAFSGDALYRATRGRGAAIKQVLMDSHVVAGIGNIYASEALFRAGINPKTPARRLGPERCRTLVTKIRETLTAAIDAGGSSLRDYVNSEGRAGNFQNAFLVYDREGQPCSRCSSPIRALRQGQRSTFYCPRCQRR